MLSIYERRKSVDQCLEEARKVCSINRGING